MTIDARLTKLEDLAPLDMATEKAALLARLTPATGGAEIDKLLARMSEAERGAFVAECAPVLIAQSIEHENEVTT